MYKTTKLLYTVYKTVPNGNSYKGNFESYSENIERWSRRDVTWQTVPVCCININ